LRASVAICAAVGALVSTAVAKDSGKDDAAWSTRAVSRGGEISKKVAKLRGLKIKRPIAMGVMNDAQIRARLLERLDEDSPPAERAAEAAMMKRWGLVPWDEVRHAMCSMPSGRRIQLCMRSS
jgi:hypothetical protein